MAKKHMKASVKNVNQSKKNMTEKENRPKMKIAPWLIASIAILFIVIVAYKEYISSLVSQILLVATVVIFTGYQRYVKYKART
jgi:phosphatidylglycerophosphate synthase